MIRFAFVTLAALATALLVGCGGDTEKRAAASDATAATTTMTRGYGDTAMRPAGMRDKPAAGRDTSRAAKRGTTVRIVSSQFGRILADRRGQAFYYFDREKTRRSECYGACAKAWPPVLARGVPVAGKGIRARWISTTRRRDGRRQVTYRGRPLYYYVDDAPGRVLCHNVREFGGLWLVIKPNGRPVG